LVGFLQLAGWRGDASYFASAQGLAMSISARDIHELNIRHYRKLLETETDPGRRQTITLLLRKEEASLAKLDRSVSRRSPSPSRANRASETD
jgi:hypothetical protein